MANFFPFPFHFKETEGTKKPVDVSSLLLIEATGDSEVDFDPNMVIHIDLADDDAESCSYDVSDYSCISDLNSCLADEEAFGNAVDGDNDNDDKQQPQQQKNEGVRGYHQAWTGPGFPMDQKSCASVDSTNKESLNEMENNRLFWETCLAS